MYRCGLSLALRLCILWASPDSSSASTAGGDVLILCQPHTLDQCSLTLPDPDPDPDPLDAAAGGVEGDPLRHIQIK